ncbi:MAG: alpha-amylase family glycosyl hydrolase [Puniceicoccaceae bacterium]
MEPETGLTHLNWAAWTSLKTGLVSFTCDWEDSTRPELWWGEDKLKLTAVKRISPEQYGLTSGYFGRRGRIVFVLPEENLDGLDISEGVFVAGSFNGWDEAIGVEKWKMYKGAVKGHECHLLSLPMSQLANETNATFKFVTGGGLWIDVPETARNTHVDSMGIKNYLFSCNRTGRHIFRFTTPLPLNQSEGRKLCVQIGNSSECIRMMPGVFLKGIDAPGPFGAIVEESQTIFRIFAPRARAVNLYLFDKRNGPTGKALEMELGEDLVWEVRVRGNRHGWFYYYTVEGEETNETGYFDPEFRILDPYARAAAGPLGPGIVVEDSYFDADHEPFHPPHWHDLVIAEAHVRDLTDQAPLKLTDEERLGFKGLQRWVEEESFYLKELGVNAVELQPVQEFDTVDRKQYAWGYMPVNYFSPASQYCRNPHRLEQIDGLRDLVKAFHRNEMAVILDVVYNHVGEPNFLQYLDKEYYFLLDDDGNYHNYSGCGNTLDADAPMVRQLMRDSLVHLIKAYDVDGFRFDLGELIGIDALSWLEAELKKVKPSIVLIAEPWSFRSHIGKQLKKTGFASWNDGYREYMREFITLQSDSKGMRHYMQGSRPDWSRFPAQTVNYVASHDDRCWLDKITENGNHDGHRPTATDRRRTHLMAGILMMSLGIPMVASGMDMMKSKGGTNNTYLRGDLNAIPYTRMAEYSGTVDYFRKWIRFRLGDLGRLVRLDRFPGREYFTTSRRTNAFGMIYNADYSHGSERLLFVVNSGYEYKDLRFADEDLESFSQLCDTERWGDPFLEPPNYTLRKSKITVPAMSCGLFIQSC